MDKDSNIDWEKAKQTAILLANVLAPDGQVQRGFIKLVRELEVDSNPPLLVVEAILNSILDGLLYGNWVKGGLADSTIVAYWRKHAAKAIEQGEEHFRVPRLTCVDGFSMSVQASRHYYCTPRETIPSGEYLSWEVGFPTAVDERLMPYAQNGERPLITVYEYVPTDVVDAVIAAHGGLAPSLSD